jgi:UDP-GlcNAc:undecaprenyl-phosphate/decaprenyl-phosphate GlcNAc-1-phosphate transferase
MSYFLYFILAIVFSSIFTYFVKIFANKFKVLDIPNSPKNVHQLPTPLLGGLAVFLSFCLILFIYLFFNKINFSVIPVKFFSAIIGGGLVLMLGGFLDDKYDLPPKFLWLFPAIASLIIVASGIGVGIKQISNPFGSPFSIDYNFFIFPLSGIIIWIYLMGMIFTTKFLDGLDGLCAGISFIGGLTLFALSLLPHINQTTTASLAIIFSGSLFGFLIFNFHPAKIFLGEAGSTFSGFMLGVLSVILGGKIATVLLVMGIPILDVAWAIIRRLFYGQSPFKGDRTHLHHRLLDIGLSHRQTVLILWLISAIFGFTAVFLQSFGKLIALGVLFIFMLFLAVSVVIIYKKKHPFVPNS